MNRNFRRLCCLVFISFFSVLFSLFTSCSSKDQNNSQQEDLQGVGQGNGMLVYQNNTMGLKFSYPPTWTLTENSEKTVAAFNIPVTIESSEKWYLNFSYVSTIFDSQPKNPADLKKILELKIPSKKWNLKNFSGREVVYSTEQIKKNEWANYYLLDSRSNILQIEYLFGKTLEPEKFVRTIMKSILIDDEAPVIQRIWLDQAQITPGATLRLYAEITDDLSGVDLDTLGVGKYDYGINFATIGYNTDQLTAIGSSYSCPKVLGYQHDYPRCELSHHYTILLNNKFKYLEGNIFYYDIPISSYAPLGELVLTRFDVKDFQGNSTRFDALQKLETAQFSKFEYYSACSTVVSQTPRCEINSPKVVTSEVIPPTVGNYTPDLKRPELTDLYWSSPSVIFDRNMEVNLHLQFSDESPIQSEMEIILRANNPLASTPECLTPTKVTSMGNNKFIASYRIPQTSNCTDVNYLFKGDSNPIKIWVEGVKIRDEVSRSRDFFVTSKPMTPGSLPMPSNYKAVVFPKHLFLLNP